MPLSLYLETGAVFCSQPLRYSAFGRAKYPSSGWSFLASRWGCRSLSSDRGASMLAHTGQCWVSPTCDLSTDIYLPGSAVAILRTRNDPGAPVVSIQSRLGDEKGLIALCTAGQPPTVNRNSCARDEGSLVGAQSALLMTEPRSRIQRRTLRRRSSVTSGSRGEPQARSVQTIQ
jgi:hypothetical protein